MSYHLGIDLGTTYTAAATHDAGRIEVVPLGDRGPSIPSVLFLRPDGNVVAGDTANRQAVTNPERIAREFKRRLGDPTPISLGGMPTPPELLTGHLLRWVYDVVVRAKGAMPAAVTLTHPANWGTYKRDLLVRSAETAGLNQVTLVTEPQAAAISYASQERVEPGAVVAVYDLGGGTFDAAVLRKDHDGSFSILGTPEGIERLGGIDFDAAVFAHVSQTLEGVFDELDPDDAATVAAVARLRQECTQAKEALSLDNAATIPVLLPNTQTEVHITRGELESMIRPALAETVTALERALRSASLAAANVSHVLLVGGSSRIPVVAELVSAELGRPVAIDAHPKHAVALGAAIVAARAAGIAVGDALDGQAGGWSTSGPPSGSVPLVASAAGMLPPPPTAAVMAGAAVAAGAGLYGAPAAGAAVAPNGGHAAGMPGVATPSAATMSANNGSSPPQTSSPYAAPSRPPPPQAPLPGAHPAPPPHSVTANPPPGAAPSPYGSPAPGAPAGNRPPPPRPAPPGSPAGGPAGAAASPYGATPPPGSGRSVFDPTFDAAAQEAPPPSLGYQTASRPPPPGPPPPGSSMDLPPGYKTPEQRHMARRKQVRKGRAGLLIGAVILLLCIGATLALTARQNAPQTLADMEVGECYVGQNVGDLEVVECDQPHHGELFAVVGTEGLEDEYIGEDALRTDRGNVCIVELATGYYGAGPDVAAANGLEIKPFVPTEADWNGGERDTYCVATAASGDTMTGSIEGEGAAAAPATTAPPPPG